MTRNGFTLVELMVVMTLVALAGAAVVVTMGSRDGGAAEAASRFAGRLGAARDEAVIGGAPVTAWVSASGYGFERLSGGRWTSLEEKPLVGSDWPQGVSVTAAGRSSARAQVRFDPLGLPSDASTFLFADQAAKAEVRIDANGDILVR
jgi:general secretion pathway protein H